MSEPLELVEDDQVGLEKRDALSGQRGAHLPHQLVGPVTHIGGSGAAPSRR